MTTNVPDAKLILLTTTHRVAPGLLAWPAWEALRSAGRVLAADEGHPQVAAVRQAGVEVEVVAAGSAPALARLLTGQPGGAGPTVWLGSPDGDPGLTDALARLAVEHAGEVPEIEVLPGSYDLPGRGCWTWCR